MDVRKAWSTFTITKSSGDGDERIIEGIASTPTTDRAGDIVEPKGAIFTLPLPLLSQHDARFPIGHVVEAKVSTDGIRIKATIVKDTGLNYVELAWAQIKAGLVRGLSIGFSPKEYSRLENGGLRFLSWDWLELSAVTIPANADASIATIKALDLAAALPGIGAAPSGRSAISPLLKGPTMSTISDRIKAASTKVEDLRAKLAALIEDQDDDAPDAAITADITKTNGEIEAQLSLVAQYTSAEKQMGVALVTRPASREPITIEGVATEIRSPKVLRKARADENERPSDLLFKMAATTLIADVTKRPVENVLDHYYKDTEVADLMMRQLLQKATVAPATTTGATWAAPLVQTVVADFLDLLTPLAAYGKLAAAGTRIDFGQSGIIKIPYRNDTPGAAGDLRGAFVAEGAPIPVRIASITSTTFTPKKVAVITAYTREVAKMSLPAIEGLLRQWILRDTAIAIDTALLDAVAGGAERPPGLRNTVTPAAATAGTTLASVIGDLTSAISAYTLSQEMRSFVWLMNPTQALFLSLLTTSVGNFMFPTVGMTGGTLLGYPIIVSGQVPNHLLMLVDASAFFSATGDSPEFEVSSEATLHMDDGGYATNQTAAVGTTTVLPVSATGTPNVVAAPVRSLYQTASYALRMIMDMDWGLVRSGSVVSVTTNW